MCIWCPAFELDGESGEEEDLDGGSAGIPEWAGDTITVGDTGGLEEGCGPGDELVRAGGGKCIGPVTNQVQDETTADATRPVFTVRPAVENISEVWTSFW